MTWVKAIHSAMALRFWFIYASFLCHLPLWPLYASNARSIYGCACYGCKQRDGALVPQCRFFRFLVSPMHTPDTITHFQVEIGHYYDGSTFDSWVRQPFARATIQHIDTLNLHILLHRYYDYGLLKLWLIITMFAGLCTVPCQCHSRAMQCVTHIAIFAILLCQCIKPPTSWNNQ